MLPADPAGSVDVCRRHVSFFAMEITFSVETCAETGGFVARWDDPTGGGITTQGDTLAELQTMVSDAVGGYFADGRAPARVRLHFVQDPVFAVA